MTTSDPTLATEIAEVTADKGRSPAATVGPARRRSPSSLAATQPWSPASCPYPMSSTEKCNNGVKLLEPELSIAATNRKRHGKRERVEDCNCSIHPPWSLSFILSSWPKKAPGRAREDDSDCAIAAERRKEAKRDHGCTVWCEESRESRSPPPWERGKR
uniref:Uncharacterized protein n=1 Tax=Oryza meridionalis TaxID=40149 RepID=A0A0E0CIJ0_9ORYZ